MNERNSVGGVRRQPLDKTTVGGTVAPAAT